MLLLVGVLLIVFGISDLVIAALLARRAAESTGGLDAETPAVSRLLRGTGMVTILVGAVLAVIGLVS